MRASASKWTARLFIVAGVVFVAAAASAQMVPQQMMPPGPGMPPQYGGCMPPQYPGACMPNGSCMGPECGAPMGEYGGGDGCCQPPRWTFTADILALQRSTTRSQALFQNASGGDDLNSKYLNFPAEAGFQVAAIRHGDCGWDVEVGYFQIDGWEARAAGTGATFLVTDANLSNLSITDPQARYTSEFHIGEINVRRQTWDWLTLLAGFRMGEYNERYSAFGIDAFTPDTLSMYSNTFNHLYGFQIGADAEVFNLGGPLRVNALCKAGIYGNWASQTINQTIPPSQIDQTLSSDRCHTAFMGEAGLVATYQVTCHLAVRASYQAVWLEGVALAPEQIGATDFLGGTANIDTAGGVFYHGGGLGLELKF